MNQPLAIGLLNLATAVSSWSLTPAELFTKVEAKYESLNSIAYDSTTIADLDTSDLQIDGGPRRSITHCKARLSRPKLYRIEWYIPPHGSSPAEEGAAWSDGEKHYLSNGRGVTEYENADRTLGAGVGVSQGSTLTISQLFFDRPLNLLRTLRDPILLPDENLGGLDCYVISGTGPGARKTIWITKDFLVLQQRTTRDSTIPAIPFSNEQILEPLEGELAAETKKTLQSWERTGRMKGTTTETFNSIDLNPELGKDIFEIKDPTLPSLPR